jgi:DNA ligase-1
VANPFRPMLAATIDSVQLQVRFPVLVSPKLDGVRCVIIGGKALSRSLKPIPNAAARAALESMACLEGCDGELMVAGATFQDVTSAFMRRESPLPAGWYFGVFDHVSHFSDATGIAYSERQKRAAAAVEAAATTHVQLVPQLMIRSADELDVFEGVVLSLGHEGVMVRQPSAPYKFGRSTAGDGALLKLKRFADGEATVIGVVERMHNGNVATTSELGRTKRSSAKAGKVANGALGALMVRDLQTGVEFEVGTGFTEAQRIEFWQQRESGLIDRICKYKHFAIGAMNKPRFPVFLGWRAQEDMSLPDDRSAV